VSDSGVFNVTINKLLHFTLFTSPDNSQRVYCFYLLFIFVFSIFFRTDYILRHVV